MFGGTMLAMGGSKAKKTQSPPINAQSPDEEKFVQYVHVQPSGISAFGGFDVNTRSQS